MTFVAILAKMGYDVHVAFRVVQQNEHAMKYVPQVMQGDRELCAAAVAQNWQAFEWVSQEMILLVAAWPGASSAKKRETLLSAGSTRTPECNKGSPFFDSSVTSLC